MLNFMAYASLLMSGEVHRIPQRPVAPPMFHSLLLDKSQAFDKRQMRKLLHLADAA